MATATKTTYAPNQQLPSSVAGPIQAQISAIQKSISSLGSSTPTSSSGSGGVGAVNAQGQLVNSSGQVIGTANPADRYSPSAKQAEAVSPTDLSQPTVDNSQPSPEKAQAGQYTVKPGDTLSGIAQSQGVGMSQISGYKSGDPNKIFPGEQLSLKQQYQNAANLAKQTGQPASADAGAGSAVAQKLLGAAQGGPALSPAVQNFLNPENPMVQDSTKQLMEWLNPEADRMMLQDHIKQLSADRAELGGLKTDLMNIKRVMSGTDQDIRDEITKSNGFATDSLVQALTIGRNKSLVQKAQLISDQIQSQTDLVNSDISLVGEDKQMAAQQFNQRMSLLNYQQENARYAYSAAKDSFQNVVNAIGYDGAYQAYQNDPAQLSYIEKISGLGSQGLQQAAVFASQKRQQEQYKADLQNRVLESNLLTDKYQRANIQSEIDKRIADSKPIGTTPIMLEKQAGNINDISALAQDKYLTSAVGPNALSRVSLSNVFTGGKSNFVAGIEQLRSRLNLDSLINAKSQGATFGALSDQEMQVLANTATKMGTWAIKDKNGQVTGYKASEGDFKKELDKINNYAKLDFVLKGGNPAQVGIKQMPDGTYWTQNSDGTFTQIQ